MKFKFQNKELNQLIGKFQEGGEMAAPAAEQAPQQDPMEAILQAAAQAVQAQDGNLALQVCQALVEMAGGGQQAAPEAPGQPVYKKGGKLSRWI